MHESSDRRSTLLRLAASATAAGAAVARATIGSPAAAAAAANDAETEKKRKHRHVNLAVGGTLSGVTYTPVNGDDDTHWTIRGRQKGSAEVDHMKSGKRDRMSGAALHRLMMKKTGGHSMKGLPQFTVGGMNWRIATADYDSATGEWTLDAYVCDSNPNARPVASRAGASAESSLDPVSGCNCSGCSTPRCYMCDDGTRRCGKSFCNACQGCW